MFMFIATRRCSCHVHNARHCAPAPFDCKNAPLGYQRLMLPAAKAKRKKQKKRVNVLRYVSDALCPAINVRAQCVRASSSYGFYFVYAWQRGKNKSRQPSSTMSKAKGVQVTNKLPSRREV